MSGQSPERLSVHSHRLVHLFGYLLILVVVLRRRYDLEGMFLLEHALILLGIFTLLYASEAFVTRRISSYTRVYFAVQSVLVLLLGAFRDYQDTWAFLFIVLGLQIAVRFSRKEALIWYGLFTLSLLITLSLEYGFISGLGRALAYGIIGMLIISYDIQYAQHEDALAESQVLLAELKEAHQKLQDYAAQAEELAAAEERNRMIQELYDSVGQKVFAIQLAAETTRMMMDQEPLRASQQIDDLQEQTQSALSQMRQLIGQWRPG